MSQPVRQQSRLFNVDRLLKDVSVICDRMKPTLFIYNLSAIKLIGNPEFHERPKHIETRYHFMHQLLAEKMINIRYILCEEQVADVFTKGLPSEKLTTMKKWLGFRKCQAEMTCCVLVNEH